MEKYLKKSAKQLKQEMLEMTQALEKIRQEKIQVYGEIFLDIVEGIDDVNRAEAYFKILDANASKAQKKILCDAIDDLKKLAGIEDKPSVKNSFGDTLIEKNTSSTSLSNVSDYTEKVKESLGNHDNNMSGNS